MPQCGNPKIEDQFLQLTQVLELLGWNAACGPIQCAHPAAHMLNVVSHQGREAVVQTQHQADPLCTRGNRTGSLAWIKERRGFAHGLGKDPFAQPQFFSCALECPPQYSVLLHIAKPLPNRCARLVACPAHLGLGVQGLAGASGSSTRRITTPASRVRAVTSTNGAPCSRPAAHGSIQILRQPHQLLRVPLLLTRSPARVAVG